MEYLHRSGKYQRLDSLGPSIELHNLNNIHMNSSASLDVEKSPVDSSKQQQQSSSDNNSYDHNSMTGDVTDKQVVRGLKVRHISMISLGGTIGTGLFISIGGSLEQAGAVGALIAFLFVGSIIYSITQSLGELAAYIPVTGSFVQFVTRFISRPLGAANGWLYWFSWAMTFAVEISVVGQVIEFWTFKVPIAGWIAIFYVILTLANLIPVKFYGEIEFWIAAIKVIAIVGWIIYALCMVCGAGDMGAIGFHNWKSMDRAFGPGILVQDKNTGRFLGWVSSLISAAFTYQGTELVGITAGEAANPRVAIKKAINKVFFRILIFYVISLFFVGLLVSYDDPSLAGGDSYIAASPFVIAIINSGTPVLPHIFNAVILTTIISAGNSNVYIGSRILYGLAESNVAPKFFMKTTKGGVPYIGVLFTSAFGLLAFMVTSNKGTTVFNWFLNITAVAGLICWAFISIAHIRFMNILKSRGISRDELPFRAMFMPFSAWYAAIATLIVTFVQGYAVFFDFNATGFFTAYVSIILFVVLWIGFQIYYRDGFLIPLDECDIDTGRREVDDIIWEDNSPKNWWEKMWDFLA